jgi:hypothetical protein
MIIDKFTIQTPDSIDIARDKVTRQIDNNPPLFKTYITGQVSGNTFNLCRISSGGTIPFTTINGYFEAVKSNTIIHLELEVKSTLIVFFLLFVLFSFVHIWWITRNDSSMFIYIYIGMMTVFIANFTYSFQAEKMFYRKKLPQIFL